MSADTQLSTTSPSVAVRIIRHPPRIFGFELAPLSVEIQNIAEPGLASTDRFADFILTLDLWRLDGTHFLNLAALRMTRPIAIGAADVVDGPVWIRAFDGEYWFVFGFHERPDRAEATSSREVPLAGQPIQIRIESSIKEMFIELTNICNFRCTFCPQVDLERAPKMMDLDLAKKILGELAAMGHHHPVRLHLLGEPLLYKRFREFVDAAHSVGQTIRLATNGSRFSRETIDMLFETRLDEIVVSLNTPDREGYDAQRGTAVPFETYIEGIHDFIAELVRRGPPPETWVNILYDGTKRDDPAELARVRRIADQWIDLVRRLGGRTLPTAEEAIRLTDQYATFLELSKGLRLQWTAYHDWGHGRAVPPAQNHFCYFPWFQFAILVDGKATACCVDTEGEIVLGDATRQTVSEIWNGPELTRIRDGFLQNRALSPRCIRCDVAHKKDEFFPNGR